MYLANRGKHMTQKDKTVFISYRRTDIAWGLNVYKDLTARGFDVFFDFQNIDSGSFEQIILQNIASRAHFVVILTPSALERCTNPDDWLRREIEYALETRRNIVPLMLEGFDYGSPAINKYLTGKLAALKEFNAQRIPADFFDEAMARVRDRFLNTSLDAVIYPASVEAQRAAQAQQRAASAAPAVEEKALSASEWFEKGYQAQEIDGNHSEAIRCYDEAIRLKPDYATAYYNRGNAHADRGDQSAARRDYDEVIRLKPDYALAYNNRGNAHREQGDQSAALRDYDEAIRLKPDLAKAYYNRGNAHREQGDQSAARRDYDEAIRLKPDYDDAYVNRGNAHYNQGDQSAALRDYDEAIRLKPDLADAYVNRGIVHYHSSNLDATIADWEAALRIDPNYASAKKNLEIARRQKAQGK